MYVCIYNGQDNPRGLTSDSDSTELLAWICLENCSNVRLTPQHASKHALGCLPHTNLLPIELSIRSI